MENLIPTKGILKSVALQKYIFDTTAYPREHEELKKLREATVHKYGNFFFTNLLFSNKDCITKKKTILLRSKYIK
ncbi:BnaC08g09620D [Brassica napus]|uniref:BnaC08g09620D protein n=1 Tax=Brassica napus TaxID=3708 RepID=A0A078HER4_BRANA|nr:BnaC08g09620D [Brassica napus]